jgi:flagellar biosynthesis GTPase FlhF
MSMDTMDQQLTDTPPGQHTQTPPRTYRGRDLAEILPRIRAELGADAVITCQREGLVGGVGGFFAQRFVEVEATTAQASASHIDFYDDEGDADDESLFDPSEAPTERLATIDASDGVDGVIAMEPEYSPSEPIVRKPAWERVAASADAASVLHDESANLLSEPGTAAQPARYAATARENEPMTSFAQQLAAVSPESTPEAPPQESTSLNSALQNLRAPFPLAHTAPAPEAAIAGEARVMVAELLGRGFSERLAEDLVSLARMHDLPFSGDGTLREAVRSCLTRLLPRFRGLPRGGALVALVGTGGSGKTRCAASIAAAYSDSSSIAARAVVLGRYDSGAELSALLAGHSAPVHTAERGSRASVEIASSRAGELVIADTPAASPGDPAGVGMLGVELETLGPEEVLLTLPATVNMATARQLLSAFAPLSPTAIIVTHADETDQWGTAIELSLESGLPLAFIHEGLALPGALLLAEPAYVSARLVP